MTRRMILPGLTTLALLAGCTASTEPGPPQTPSPFAECTALTASPATSAGLPDLTFPCFTGGRPVALRSLPGPAVINIWASWCGPCREELPVMQGLADRTEGRLTVLGVNSADRREGAASFAADHGVSMPTVVDREGKLAIAIEQVGLPATIFVGADGEISVHRRPLDVDELIDQVREHTGVTVAR